MSLTTDGELPVDAGDSFTCPGGVRGLGLRAFHLQAHRGGLAIAMSPPRARAAVGVAVLHTGLVACGCGSERIRPAQTIYDCGASVCFLDAEIGRFNRS